jgi:hypothetical protein
MCDVSVIPVQVTASLAEVVTTEAATIEVMTIEVVTIKSSIAVGRKLFMHIEA